MKKIIVGFLILVSQASFAAESCTLSISLAADATKITARLLDEPGSYENIEFGDAKKCSEQFLTILKSGQKVADIEGLEIPIEYQYILKGEEGDDYLKVAAENAKIGGFEITLSADAMTVVAVAKK